MMNAPACLIVECGEKRIMHCISNFHNRATNEFAKAFLIADFFTQSYIPHEDNLLAKDGDLKDVA